VAVPEQIIRSGAGSPLRPWSLRLLARVGDAALLTPGVASTATGRLRTGGRSLRISHARPDTTPAPHGRFAIFSLSVQCINHEWGMCSYPIAVATVPYHQPLRVYLCRYLHTVRLSSGPCADQSPYGDLAGRIPSELHSRICSTETRVRSPVAGPLWPALFSCPAQMLAGGGVTHTMPKEIRAI